MEIETGIVKIPVGEVKLEADLRFDDSFQGLVIFAHGSGSSRKSPRNNFVSDVIIERGIGTMLFDLLTENEDRIYQNRFDIPLLTSRLTGVTGWIQEKYELGNLSIGYFGASTGAAAALNGAVQEGSTIQAVVSRGGRVDMATDALPKIQAATLFIVGGNDPQVLQLNRDAFERLKCEQKKLEVIPGAGHLFSGPGELEQVANLAAGWFERHLK